MSWLSEGVSSVALFHFGSMTVFFSFRYSVLQVEARWRMLVTTYKSMVDHNIMPTVEPITAAFHERLSQLVNYEPRRRKDYERYKGKKVKLGEWK